MMQRYENENQEAEYLKIVGQDRPGFVVNQRKCGADHLMLHRASCAWISDVNRVAGPFLKDLRKIWFDNLIEAEKWMQDNRSEGHEIKYCKVCNPKST
jgi:hypothetical protein